ncbi:MAG: zinc ribbon domain-containing protein [Clostridia bacterium]|nr:zinc ribbon domain-containing protein [Clostridia bacterium]
MEILILLFMCILILFLVIKGAVNRSKVNDILLELQEIKEILKGQNATPDRVMDETSESTDPMNTKHESIYYINPDNLKEIGNLQIPYNKCPACGTEISENESICPLCGLSLL